MLFESTRILLRGIVQSIEKGDLATWDDHLESGIQCLYELHQMSRPASRAYKTDVKSQAGGPVSDRAVQAIPHVKLMVSAIRRKDQSAALVAGRAAVVEMNGMVGPRPVRPMEVAPPAPVVNKAPEVVVAVAPAAAVAPAKAKSKAKPKKAAPKHRPAVGKGKKLARAIAR
jgi:hypothetical protein